jgi:hypothetical protein
MRSLKYGCHIFRTLAKTGAALAKAEPTRIKANLAAVRAVPRVGIRIALKCDGSSSFELARKRQTTPKGWDAQPLA